MLGLADYNCIEADSCNFPEFIVTAVLIAECDAEVGVGGHLGGKDFAGRDFGPFAFIGGTSVKGGAAIDPIFAGVGTLKYLLVNIEYDLGIPEIAVSGRD